MSEEPLRTTSVAGPAVLAGVVMLLAHAAASALLTVIAATFTPGAGVDSGALRAGLFVVAAALAGASLRPILRRGARPVTTGVVAGILAAAAYGGISVGLAEAGAATPLLWGRLLAIAAAAAAAGALSRHGPPDPAD